MVYDVVDPDFGIHYNQEVEEPPNLDAKKDLWVVAYSTKAVMVGMC